MTVFVKQRGIATPGSIAEALDIFGSEVRFYREIAPTIGVRVPACYRAEESADGTLLELEDLSSWTLGADPESAAEFFRDLHTRWSGKAGQRWPWLRPIGAAANLVENLYDKAPPVSWTSAGSCSRPSTPTNGRPPSPPTAPTPASTWYCRPSSSRVY
jgi:hypothetical protein